MRIPDARSICCWTVPEIPGCRIIIADALDDEPYISSQLAPALEMTDQLVRGIELAKEAVGAESARIEIYKELGIRR